MKKWFSLFLMITIAGLIFISCSDDEGTTAPANSVPSCMITKPANNTLFIPGDNIEVIVDSEDNDGNIYEVRFYFDGIGIASDDSFPYSHIISTGSYSKGTYTIKVESSDNEGGESIDSVIVRLNTPPVINSLTSDTVSVEGGDTSIFTCVATDADADVLTYTWTASGGTIIGTSSSEIWTAPVDAGVYTIICTVSDGDVSLNDSTTIEVTPPRIVFIQGGTFNMGDHFNEGGSNELPVHSVLLNDFEIGRYEITQSEWEQYMSIPAYGGSYGDGVGDDYPVYHASWYEILVYCNKRSITEELTPCYTISSSTNPDDWGTIPTGMSNSTWDAVVCTWDATGYRLPTEAEWEYAARGGIHNADNYRYSGSDSLNFVAWYSNNSGTSSHPVGTKAPNQLGIYDMSGNIFEWCWDLYGSTYYTTCNDYGTVTDPRGPSSGIDRVYRGGDYSSYNDILFGDDCRVSYRTYDTPGTGVGSSFNYGFRVVRTP